MPATPRLTIGLPLYRNARTIERTIRSLLAQSYADWTMLISDDGSPDDTVAIARRLTAGDSRVEIVVQPRNLNYGNFRYVLQRAATELFMWAPGDDWWEPTYVERCIEALDANPEAICAVSQVMMHPEGAAPYLTRATYPLTGERLRNVARYVTDVGDNSRMYGVYRTAVAQASFPKDDYHAFDWAFCACSLQHGHYVRVEETLMHREVTPDARYVEYVRRDNAGSLNRLFPLLPMTKDMLQVRALRGNRHVLRALIAANFDQHLRYTARYHPRLRGLYGRLGLADAGPE